MNLAEFPLAAIADRVPGNQKTLVFEDRIFDSGKSEMITRRLTISASDKYGLPTSLDSDVILGLKIGAFRLSVFVLRCDRSGGSP